MNVFSFISNIFEPAVKLIDEIHTSDEEKLQLQAQIKAVENELLAKVMDYESQLLKSKTAIITAEATGQSWIQRNWRPITMLTFLVLVVLDSFGVLAFRLSEDAWTLLKIGLGGYVAGRSAEKITQQYLQARPAENKNNGIAKG
ncbi:holin family protein [Paraglaciecola aquimarina]|uniref:Holin family protein n=1 Tax=Paraglaciecola algarum TaxID=3050085 RepID=A0ABS9D897_9ALTE|nr:3TM-type holin [Paraglaciecola sp. G1-23]MCF2949197.1 holin family protein [Paraglaciecola sp. G1-23]